MLSFLSAEEESYLIKMSQQLLAEENYRISLSESFVPERIVCIVLFVVLQFSQMTKSRCFPVDFSRDPRLLKVRLSLKIY